MVGWDGHLELMDAWMGWMLEVDGWLDGMETWRGWMQVWAAPGPTSPTRACVTGGSAPPRIPTSPLIKAAKLMRAEPSAAAPWGRIKARVGRAWGRRAGSAITPVKKTSL